MQSSAKTRNQRNKVDEEVEHKATQCGSARQKNQTKKVDKEVQRNATQHGSARKRNQRNEVDEEFNARQRRSARKRNQRNKVDKGAQRNATLLGSVRKRNQRNKVNKGVQRNATQCSAAVQEREIREIKSTKKFNAVWLISRKMHSSLQKQAYTVISFSSQLKPQFRCKRMEDMEMTYIASKFNFDSGPSKKLMGKTGDFIMNICNLIKIPSTKLALYSMLCHQQALVPAVCNLE